MSDVRPPSPRRGSHLCIPREQTDAFASAVGRLIGVYLRKTSLSSPRLGNVMSIAFGLTAADPEPAARAAVADVLAAYADMETWCHATHDRHAPTLLEPGDGVLT